MNKTLFAIGLCTIGTLYAQQNQPDSIHIVLHENQNGNVRVLDTIVPLSQQQQLFTWMESNGWDAPPPPVPGQPMMFEKEIVIDGEHPGAGERMMFVTTEGDTMYPKHPQVIMIRMEGDSGMMPPIPPMPPMPPGECRKVVVIDDGQLPEGKEGDVVFMRHPMPPPVPGSQVEVNVETKDTIIDGKTRKMIVKTERIILPEGVEAPPAPPMPPHGPKSPTPPAPPQNQKQVGTTAKQDLLVYPNPASEIISVEFDIAAKEKTTLRVIDMNGKVIYTEEFVDDSGKHVYREINLAGKGKGTYTVEVKSAKKVIAEKVILQ